MSIVLDGTTGVVTPGLSSTSNATVTGTGKVSTGFAVGNATPLTNGITFPAVQAGVIAGANTLDDYAEGNWTMTLAFGGASVGITYTTRTNNYTIIGNRVFFDLLLQTSSKGSSTGNITIDLPIAAAAGVAVATINGNLDGAVATAITQIYGRILAGSSTMEIGSYNTGNSGALTDANVNNITAYRFSGSYQK